MFLFESEYRHQIIIIYNMHNIYYFEMHKKNRKCVITTFMYIYTCMHKYIHIYIFMYLLDVHVWQNVVI